MAYTAPTSRSTGDIVTAAIWNQDVVANVIDLHAGNLPSGMSIAGNLVIGYSGGSGGQFYSATGNHYFRNETGPVYQAIYASAFNVVSDERLKENVQPIEDALERIRQLRGVTFDWSRQDGSGIGLIAQETRDVFPEVVSEGDPLDDGEPVLAIDYATLVGPLIEAVKTLADRVEQLEAQTA